MEQQLQSIVQELQIIRGQIQSLTAQFNEVSLTIEALNNQSPDRSVYRALGGVLLEVEDRESLANDLASTKETLETHLVNLNEREEELRDQYKVATENTD
jgi:chaperonin cofactor prefoldin